MNIEELNSCFDSITPTKEQRDKILAGVMKAKNQPVKVVKFHRYASLVAAVFIIGVFAAVYPQISKNTVPVKVDAPTVAVQTDKENPNLQDNMLNTLTEDTEVKENAAAVPKERTVTGMVKETYPKEVAETKENTSMAALNEDIAVSKAAKDPEADLAADKTEDINNLQVASSGGGGGASSYSESDYESLNYNQIMNNEVFSELVPVYFAGDYAFVSSEAYDDGSLSMFFTTSEGKKMYVTIVKEDLYNPENVINPEDIKAFENTKYIGFAVKCGEHYVYYNINEGTAEDIYKMVTSSAYYN